uniref:BRF2-like C-terminal domain-containing protein n=1 Tax=Nelumbo nucifera TaxID=4432 RepID=A0A822Z3C0_NELNU|nr:TPA_asm: hypothetical protein HUJ06_008606 [Nelumbo nucifera]
MIQQITDEEFGGGEWFLVLVGACSYVVMRKNSRPLSIAEVASVIGCDVYELGRMIFRAVDFLDLKLPEFDIVTSFEQAIRTCPTFSRFSKDVMDKMVKQGRFLLQCAVKWFLTTGRRPLPMVSAILKFVAELNEVDVEIEDIAKEVHSTVATSKKRHKELKETLVKVAQKLPWGKDVTVKNIVKNAPLVIQYMEMKSRLKPGNKRKSIEPDWFNLEDVTNDSQYFELEDRNRVPCLSYDDVEKLKLSQECLAGIYSKFSKESSYFKNVGENGEDYQKNRRRYEDRESKEWWSGKSDLSKKLSLQQILEKNVGFNALPPSFVTGSLACKRRREKIDAAKLRIDEIMRPPSTVSGEKKDSCLLEDLEARKQQCKQSKGGNVDWEDFIIELLLLHQLVKQAILPRVHGLALKTTVAAVRVNALLCLGDMIQILDKHAILDILQTIQRCTAVDHSAPTLMCTLGVSNSILKQYGVEFVAEHVLPLLMPLIIAQQLNVQQFAKYMLFVKDILRKIEEKRGVTVTDAGTPEVKITPAANGFQPQPLSKPSGTLSSKKSGSAWDDDWGPITKGPTNPLQPSTASVSSTPMVPVSQPTTVTTTAGQLMTSASTQQTALSCPAVDIKWPPRPFSDLAPQLGDSEK